jgi:hypothetical protein
MSQAVLTRRPELLPVCSRFQLTAPRDNESMSAMQGISLRALVAASALSAAMGFLAPVLSADAASEAQIQVWVSLASAGLEPRALETLARITAADRRLLALRAYLRAGDSLAARWSWSQDRLAAYASTPEGKAAVHDIDAVAAAFAAENPGFTLHVNRQPRGLELQIAHWNENASVGAVASSLAASLEQRFADARAPSAVQLQNALIEWRPSVAAALAAPGLSAHGQGRAFDFQVESDGKIIAGVESASARQRWDVAGWTQKLHTAVNTTGAAFVGPLQSPYEPWHYAYTPRP